MKDGDSEVKILIAELNIRPFSVIILALADWKW